MSPVELPDPSMHTVYIVDPSQMFTRYAAAFAATARMREGAQAGFLVLARLCYLGFGILPGFFLTRYLLSLFALVPAYLLLRRLYGISAGFLAVAVLMSCPVVITAWGTDYPDSAVVSYVAGGVACLALSLEAKHKNAYLVAGGIFLTLSVWSHGMGLVLTAAAVLSYGVIALFRARRRIFLHGAVLLTTGGLCTLGLMVASRYVLGQFNFIAPAIAGAEFLNHPDQIRQWHSANWRWAPHVAYLLVPPAVVVAFFLSFARRLRNVPSAVLYVGLCAALQLAAFSYLQFGYHVQALEMHFFSSTLWGVVCLALSLLLAEMASRLTPSPLGGLVGLVVVLGVALLYEADPHVPEFGWWPTGAVLAGVVVLGAGAMAVVNRAGDRRSKHRTVVIFLPAIVCLVAVTGSLLVLTVAPTTPIPPLVNLAAEPDPSAAYAGALGGSATNLVDWYQVSAELPGFVGDPTYKGEQLLTWLPAGPVGLLIEPIGIFHAGFNMLSGLPVLDASAEAKLARRRPAELLLLSRTGEGFASALIELGPYRPVLAKTAVLTKGTAVLHVWLVFLRLFSRAPL
jgi:4-amino-4-deoxy-L-arabinose transferase-like glycosyltransferase